MASSTEWRIVLLGKTGAGKSECGNRILKNPKAFEARASPISVTKKCQEEKAKVHGLRVSVVDTPGICDTDMKDNVVKKEVGRCIELSVPGPHAFLLVIRLDVRFTPEERKAIQWIKDNFGEGALRYTIVLFTHADKTMGQSVEDFIKDSEPMCSVVSSCKNRFHAFKNKGDDYDVSKLLDKIEDMIKGNDNKHYTNDKYLKAQEKLEKRERKEKIIDGVLTGMTAVGAVTAVAGGAVLAVVEAPVMATAGIAVGAAGAAMAVGAGMGAIARGIRQRKNNESN